LPSSAQLKKYDAQIIAYSFKWSTIEITRHVVAFNSDNFY